MHLTLAEWKKLTESTKQQLCDHAFKLINSKEIDVIREGMLEMQSNLRFEPDLVKPAIACFDEEYAEIFERETNDIIEPIFIMRPQPLLIISVEISWQSTKLEDKFTSRV